MARPLLRFAERAQGPRPKIVLVAFDLLYLNGYDLRKLPLVERKALLKKAGRQNRYPIQ
jgi:ATP-dependent DNA ligase